MNEVGPDRVAAPPRADQSEPLGRSAVKGRSGRPRFAWRRFRGWGVALLIAIAAAVVLRNTVLRPPLVSVAEVVRGDMAGEIEGTGTVTADVLADVAPKITGRVEQVFVDEGDDVRKGQIVATLDETDLRQQLEAAQARLAGAGATATERQREWKREMGLVKTGAVSLEDSQQYTERLQVARSAMQAAEADMKYAQYNLSLTQIPALFSGIVTKRWVVPGASVVPGQRMFTVADTDLVYVDAHVDQNFTGKLRKDEAANVILRGREKQPLAGHVLRISPEADAATEESVAEVAFTIPRSEFELGQWANVYIETDEAKNALIVPRAALMPMNDKIFVFVVGANNELHREPITLLADSPRRSMVAVSGNLNPHERVVLMPMGLKPGEAVRPMAKNQAMEMQP